MSGPLILVVDDSLTVRTKIKRLLDGNGFRVITAADVHEATAAALEHQPDVVVLDVVLPGGNGIELCEQWRAHPALKGAQILLMSGERSGADDRAAGLRAGAFGYITKPFSDFQMLDQVTMLVELSKTLRKLSERETQDRQEALAGQKSLTRWREGAVTASFAGMGPLRERCPEVFNALQAEYGLLLDRYLEALGFDQPPPRRELNVLADRLGDYGAGPRDVVDIHVQVVTGKCDDIHPARARAYTQNGRLLALEVMGNLVDYYRLRGSSCMKPNPVLECKP